MTHATPLTSTAAILSGQRPPPPVVMPAGGAPTPALGVKAKPYPNFLTKDERVAIQKRIARAKELRIANARNSAAAFCEYVLRRENDHSAVANAAFHEEWHTLLDTHRRVLIWSHIESAKSAQISVGRVLWELGRNPNLRVAIVSETDGKAMKILEAIQNYIKNSQELHDVFPDLRRGRGLWNKHKIVVLRTSFAKDPSVQVVGAGGSIIGSRVDLLILDDILSNRNALTQAARDRLYSWYTSNCAGRITDGGRVIAVGTAWHQGDLYHVLAKRDRWTVRKFPVLRPDGTSNWPEVWSLARIEEQRDELGPVEAARQLDCEPVNDSTEIFQEASIKRALAEGQSYTFARTWDEIFDESTPPHLQVLEDGCFTVTGVDVGASLRATGGLTVLTTLLAWPTGVREILCIESGRWTGPQILQHCFEHHARYRSVVFVENNGAQQFLLDFAEVMDLPELPPVRSHTTGRNKHDPTFGVASINVEMLQGRWRFPNDHGVMEGELAGLLTEMRAYDPKSHMGDRLASLWIASMGALTMRRGAPRGTARARVFEPVDGAREYNL